MKNMYSKLYTTSTPGLWIILTDESQESIEQINEFIQLLTDRLFNGYFAYDRCYIHIMGYNGSVKVLSSGSIDYFCHNPLRVEKTKRKLSDGDGGFIEIDCVKPVWCNPRTSKQDNMIGDILFSIQDLIKSWISCNPGTPAPIVFNFSTDTIEKETLLLAERGITELKKIVSNDGNILFIAACKCQYKDSLFNESASIAEFCSKIPKSHDFIYRFMYHRWRYDDHYKSITCDTRMCFNIEFASRLPTMFFDDGNDDMEDRELVSFIDNLLKDE